MSIKKCSTRFDHPKVEASIVSVRSARVVKRDITQPVSLTPETIQTVAQLTREWVEPVLNRERLTKDQILTQLGGGKLCHEQ